MTLRSETDIQPVLRAALTLVTAGGLRGLSLRPLAEQMGTTVSALSHRFGLKDDLLAAVIDAAREADGALLDGWLKRIEALAPLDGAVLADIADLILDEMAGPRAALNRLYCELMQSVPSRPEIVAPFAAWRARRLAFWRAAARGRAHPELGADLGDVLHAYSADEVAHGLALGDLSAYRWLRRLGLRRLCGDVVPAPDVNDLSQFAICHAALGELMDGPDGHQPMPLSDWQAKAAGHISTLIIAEGADAVTHRAVAARAGVASSTLAYHFPRQEDLVQAGLEEIIARLHSRVYRPPQGVNLDEEDLSSVEIARATFAVALAASRVPGLKAYAADMRRRRGENYLIILNRQTTGEPLFDLLSAQALAITGIGQIMLDGLLDGAPGAIDRTLIDRLQTVAQTAHQAPHNRT